MWTGVKLLSRSKCQPNTNACADTRAVRLRRGPWLRLIIQYPTDKCSAATEWQGLHWGMKRGGRKGRGAAWRDTIKETKLNYVSLHRMQCMQAHTTHVNPRSTSHGAGSLTRFKLHKQRSSVDDGVGQLVAHFGPEWNVITNDRMEFQYINHGPQRLTSDLSSSQWGWHFLIRLLRIKKTPDGWISPKTKHPSLQQDESWWPSDSHDFTWCHHVPHSLS